MCSQTTNKKIKITELLFTFKNVHHHALVMKGGIILTPRPGHMSEGVHKIGFSKNLILNLTREEISKFLVKKSIN